MEEVWDHENDYNNDDIQVEHVTQIHQNTKIRLYFDKSNQIKTSGMRFRHGDKFQLQLCMKINHPPPTGLILQHNNQKIVEIPLNLEEIQTVDLEFSALDESGQPIQDSEVIIPMSTRILDEEGTVYGRIEWRTCINDIFDF